MENRQSRRKTKGKRESNFVVQGSILAVAGIIVRLIGILYRVPMTNIIGDEEWVVFPAFNVYNIADPFFLQPSMAVSRWYREDGKRTYKVLSGAESGPCLCYSGGRNLPALSPGILLISLQPQRLTTPFVSITLKNTGTHYLVMAYLGSAEDSSRAWRP